MEPELYRPEIRQICSGLRGAEGPVWDASGSHFYMVAPEVEKDGKAAGEVLKVDPLTGQVSEGSWTADNNHCA